MRKGFMWLCGVALAAPALDAQPQSAPPLAPAPATPTSPPGPPSRQLDDSAAQALVRKFKIPLAEARSRVALEEDILRLADRLRPENDEGFGGIYVQHEPVYRVIIAFTDNEEARLARLEIPASLRRHVQVKKVNRSLQRRLAEQRAFMESVNGLGLDVASYIDERTGELVIISSQMDRVDAAAAEGRLSLPEQLRKERRKPAPMIQATTPSGSYPPQAGDFIEGGRFYYDYANISPPRPGCTIGFGARWGTKYGILTAGHCEPGAPGTGYWYSFGGRWIELYAPTYESDAANTKYDFQFHPTPGIKVYNTIFIENNTSGTPFYLHVDGVHATVDQPAGTTICKYGRVTSHGCYVIDSDTYSYKNASGWRYVWEYTSGAHIVDFGDSGGPVYSRPSNGYVKAAGIITAGDYYASGGYADMVYMPIQYIDDVHPISILTAPSP